MRIKDNERTCMVPGLGSPTIRALGVLGACLAATALSLTLASGADAKKAVTVSCGETITTDTKLANDLTDCPNNGIVIGADDITLDLNGHTVDGDGVWDAYDLGIDNTAGHDRVTIEGGSIREFVEGVLIIGASDNRVRALSTSDQGHGGVYVIESSDVDLAANSSSRDCAGTIVFASHDVRVERTSVADHTCAGISVFESDHLRIADNRVAGRGDDEGIWGENESAGIFLIDSHNNRIERNAVSGNGFAGIIFFVNDDRNLVSDNHVFENNEGILIVGNGNVVTRNRVVDTLGANEHGFESGVGISFEGGHDNLIANNTVERTRLAGIRVASFAPETPATFRNTVRSNIVRDAGVDGILIASTATDTLVGLNLAVGAGDDGIDVEHAATTLARNKANANQDLGIEAVPGVTDGGGNKASGNGNPLQCTNVFCG